MHMPLLAAARLAYWRTDVERDNEGACSGYGTGTLPEKMLECVTESRERLVRLNLTSFTKKSVKAGSDTGGAQEARNVYFDR